MKPIQFGSKSLILSTLCPLVVIFAAGCERREFASRPLAETDVKESKVNATNAGKQTCENRWYASSSDNAKCYQLQKQLIESASAGDVQGITNSLENGANIEAGFDSSFPALYTAVMSGQKDAVNLLLNRGANINRVLTFGKTSLKAAVYYEQAEIAEVLIRKGADVCDNSPDEGSVWKIAEIKKNPQIINLLRRAGADKCSE
jgi:hypothetical protein